jgi:hypothetical protein
LTFLEFKPSDIISTVYTSYPTRSFVLENSVASTQPYANERLSIPINIYNSGSQNNPGVGLRSFFDARERFRTLYFYTSGVVEYIQNPAISQEMKNSLFRLRNLYASSSFKKPHNYGSSSYGERNASGSILNIPSFIVGGGIKPSSFSMQGGVSGGLPVKVVDDGYGGLYGAGALNPNKLYGCVFYEYGIAYIMSASFPADDFFVLFSDDSNQLEVHFSSTNNVPMNVYICDSPKSMLNFSNNPSYTVLTGTKHEITMETPQTFITTVGLYDEAFNLMGVAKISSPIRNQETDNAQFRLKLNF